MGMCFWPPWGHTEASVGHPPNWLSTLSWAIGVKPDQLCQRIQYVPWDIWPHYLEPILVLDKFLISLLMSCFFSLCDFKVYWASNSYCNAAQLFTLGEQVNMYAQECDSYKLNKWTKIQNMCILQWFYE